ncbi:MAG TPA: S53 family peptidase [Herpetosiphonaceae bacterium]|nr:S53 family peptidase [Herpetosiphonaceae bacterium]
MPRIAYLLSTLALLSFSFVFLPKAQAAPPPWAAVHACAPPAARFARCHALVRTDVTAQATPAGYGPADLQSAYRLPSNSTFAPGAGPTIAIVDAYDNPNAEADLAAYRSQYGLPACTTANGCFQKVGVSSSSATAGAIPPADTGWGQEIALDLDMVSAICPNCKILLVEAADNSLAALCWAEDYAAGQSGVVAISNSWSAGEASWETRTEADHFNHPGKVITASSGDNGYGVGFPASSQYVTAVGGTSLTRAAGTSRGWSETAWSGAGSGCSAYITKPSWQHDNGCSRRTVADVSAIADPGTGVAVYDTYNSGGWLVFGGTSVAAPIIASVYALAGNASTVTYGSYPYSHTGSLFDVRSGSNGTCGTYLCNARKGFDGPTGLGTPNGTGGF